MLGLALLAPDIVDAILNGRQPAEVTLAMLMQPFAVEWGVQRCSEGSVRTTTPHGQPPAGWKGRSVQELDRPSLRALLTLTDLHSHTLTFRQPAQSPAIERRRMDENILPTTILAYKTKSLIGVVPFD